ncbi:hypothetical protein L547_3408 [Bordetella pertussis H918]|nr:hypothetical protein L547_3408 [Bordetella pertussis H918]ETH72150.1 hypothetical protein L545_3438 [Bordetella pertussis STO1-CHLA-0011]
MGHARPFVFARRFEPGRGMGAGGLAPPGVRLQAALRAQVDAGLVAAGAGGQSEEQLIDPLCALGVRVIGGGASLEIVRDLQVGLLEAGAAALDIHVRGAPAQYRALQRRALEARVAGRGGFRLRGQKPPSLAQAVPAGLRVAAVDVIQAAQPDLVRLQADMVARQRRAGAVQPFGGNVQQARGIGAAVQARVVARYQPAVRIVARAGGQADPLAREVGLRGVQQAALYRDVAATYGQRAQRPRAAGDTFVVDQADSAARSIQDDVLAEECRIAGFDRRAAGVGEHRARRRHERAAGLARGARGRPRRASQVYPRHKHLLAVDRFPYVPHEVAGGARQLFGGRRLAHAQPQLGGRQRRRIHQRLHQRQAAHGVAVFVAAHGARDLFADQPGLEIIVADGPQWPVRPVADQVEEILGAVIVALVEIAQARFVQGLGQAGRRGRHVGPAWPGGGARRRGAREQAPVFQQGVDAVLDCHRRPGVGMADRVDGAARRLDPLFADVHRHVPGQQAGDVLAIGDAPARQYQAGPAGQHGLLRRIEGQFAAGCASLGGDAALEVGVARHQGGVPDRAVPVRPEHRRHGLGEQRHGRPPGRQGGLVEQLRDTRGAGGAGLRPGGAKGGGDQFLDLGGGLGACVENRLRQCGDRRIHLGGAGLQLRQLLAVAGSQRPVHALPRGSYRLGSLRGLERRGVFGQVLVVLRDERLGGRGGARLGLRVEYGRAGHRRRRRVGRAGIAQVEIAQRLECPFRPGAVVAPDVSGLVVRQQEVQEFVQRMEFPERRDDVLRTAVGSPQHDGGGQRPAQVLVHGQAQVQRCVVDVAVDQRHAGCLDAPLVGDPGLSAFLLALVEVEIAAGLHHGLSDPHVLAVVAWHAYARRAGGEQFVPDDGRRMVVVVSAPAYCRVACRDDTAAKASRVAQQRGIGPQVAAGADDAQAVVDLGAGVKHHAGGAFDDGRLAVDDPGAPQPQVRAGPQQRAGAVLDVVRGGFQPQALAGGQRILVADRAARLDGQPARCLAARAVVQAGDLQQRRSLRHGQAVIGIERQLDVRQAKRQVAADADAAGVRKAAQRERGVAVRAHRSGIGEGPGRRDGQRTAGRHAAGILEPAGGLQRQQRAGAQHAGIADLWPLRLQHIRLDLAAVDEGARGSQLRVGRVEQTVVLERAGGGRKGASRLRHAGLLQLVGGQGKVAAGQRAGAGLQPHGVVGMHVDVLIGPQHAGAVDARRLQNQVRHAADRAAVVESLAGAHVDRSRHDVAGRVVDDVAGAPAQVLPGGDDAFIDKRSAGPGQQRAGAGGAARQGQVFVGGQRQAGAVGRGGETAARGDAPRLHAQGMGTLQHAAVFQVARQRQRAGRGARQRAGIGEAGGGDVLAVGEHEAGRLVDDRQLGAAAQAQRATRGQQRAGVFHPVLDREVERGRSGVRTAGRHRCVVGQIMRGHAQRGCAQQHPVFQRAVDRRFQCAVRGDVAQVDRWATDTQADMALPRAGAVYGAALVAQPGGPDRYGLAGRVQPGVRGQQGVRDGALRLPRVDDDGHAIGQRDARALDAPAVAVGVVERTAQGQGAAQGDIDGGCGGSRLRRGRRGDDAGMRQRGVARRQADAIARGVQVGGDRCIAPCRQRNAGGLHRAVHGQRVAGLQPHAATRRVQRAVRRDPARGGAHLDIAAERDYAADQRVAAGTNRGGTGRAVRGGVRRQRLHRNAARRVDGDMAGRRNQAAVARAQAGVAGNQRDVSSVHGARGRSVDGVAGAGVRRRGGPPGRLQTGPASVVVAVGAGHDIDVGGRLAVAGADRPVQRHGAGDQVEIGQAGGIDAVRADFQPAARDVQHAAGARASGRQGQAPDIDGAQTIGGQAIGVGDEHVGGRAEYLQGALERGGRDAGHLVEDGARGPAQAGIAADPAGEGGDAFGRAVVQDHARLPYVEFGVAIMRNARRIRSGDLDHRYAIAGRGNLRCALRGDAARRRRAGRREHGQRHGHCPPRAAQRAAGTVFVDGDQHAEGWGMDQFEAMLVHTAGRRIQKLRIR